MFCLFVLLTMVESETILAIYTRVKRRMLYVARQYLKGREEDAVHDVFCKLAEKYENKMDELCDKPDAFFVTIIKNHAIDLLRKETGKQSEELLEDSAVADECHAPEAETVMHDEVERLGCHLKEVKPIYRERLEYKYFLDYSNIEIAETMGISPSLCRSIWVSTPARLPL